MVAVLPRDLRFGTEDYSPEKAGVGGSIPSLATIDSRVYKPRFLNSHLRPGLS